MEHHSVHTAHPDVTLLITYHDWGWGDISIFIHTVFTHLQAHILELCWHCHLVFHSLHWCDLLSHQLLRVLNFFISLRADLRPALWGITQDGQYCLQLKQSQLKNVFIRFLFVAVFVLQVYVTLCAAVWRYHNRAALTKWKTLCKESDPLYVLTVMQWWNGKWSPYLCRFIVFISELKDWRSMVHPGTFSLEDDFSA